VNMLFMDLASLFIAVLCIACIYLSIYFDDGYETRHPRLMRDAGEKPSYETERGIIVCSSIFLMLTLIAGLTIYLHAESMSFYVLLTAVTSLTSCSGYGRLVSPYLRLHPKPQEHFEAMQKVDKGAKSSISRSYLDPMITTSMCYLLPAGLAIYYTQYHIGIISILNAVFSTIYHKSKETQYYNFDMTYAVFSGWTLLYIFYASIPYNIYGKSYFTENISTCKADDSYFWGFVLSGPATVLLFLAAGDNAFFSYVFAFKKDEDLKHLWDDSLYPSASIIVQDDDGGDDRHTSSASSLRKRTSKKAVKGGEGKDQPLPSANSNNTREKIDIKFLCNFDKVFSTCCCLRYENPNYELLHPIWHVVSSIGPLACLTFLHTNCDTSLPLGSSLEMIMNIGAGSGILEALPAFTVRLPTLHLIFFAASWMVNILTNVVGINPPA
jgi:hypothetical protein